MRFKVNDIVRFRGKKKLYFVYSLEDTVFGYFHKKYDLVLMPIAFMNLDIDSQTYFLNSLFASSKDLCIVEGYRQLYLF